MAELLDTNFAIASRVASTLGSVMITQVAGEINGWKQHELRPETKHIDALMRETRVLYGCGPIYSRH